MNRQELMQRAATDPALPIGQDEPATPLLSPLALAAITFVIALVSSALGLA